MCFFRKENSYAVNSVPAKAPTKQCAKGSVKVSTKGSTKGLRFYNVFMLQLASSLEERWLLLFLSKCEIRPLNECSTHDWNNWVNSKILIALSSQMWLCLWFDFEKQNWLFIICFSFQKPPLFWKNAMTYF